MRCTIHKDAQDRILNGEGFPEGVMPFDTEVFSMKDGRVRVDFLHKGKYMFWLESPAALAAGDVVTITGIEGSMGITLSAI